MLSHAAQIVFLVGALAIGVPAENDGRPPITDFMTGSHPLGPPVGPPVNGLAMNGIAMNGLSSFQPPQARGLDGKLIDRPDEPLNLANTRSDFAPPPPTDADTVTIEYKNENVQATFDPVLNDPEIFECFTEQAKQCSCDSCEIFDDPSNVAMLTRKQYREACTTIVHGGELIKLPLRTVLDCISDAGVLKPHAKEAEALTDQSLHSVVFKSTQQVFKLVGGYAERTIAESEVHFTGELEKAMAALGKTDGNYVFSPVSIYSLTAALYMGTSERSESFKQLYKALGYPTVFPKRLAKKIYQYTKNIQNFNNFLIHTRNLKPRYADLMKVMHFNTEQKDSLVGMESDLNGRIEEATDNIIQNFFQPGHFDDTSSLVMVNTVLFKETWMFPFDSTETGEWNNVEGSQVDYMIYKMDTSVFVADEYQGDDAFVQYISIPFNGGRRFMTFAIPYEGVDLDTITFQRTRDSEITKTIAQKKDDQEQAKLKVPKFKFDHELNVRDVMKQVGITKIFSEESAELARIHGDESEFVSDFSHKASIEIDEKGATAAAASGVTMTFKKDMTYVIDKPFKFFIHDKKFTQPLFIGQVMCPGECGDGDNIK